MGSTEFSAKVISWFEACLSGRTFKININKKSYLRRSPKIYIRSTFVFVIRQWHALGCEVWLITDDACLTFQHENVKEIEDQLNLNFSSLCDWSINNELSIHLGVDKTKPILFGTKFNIKRAKPLNIVYEKVWNMLKINNKYTGVVIVKGKLMQIWKSPNTFVFM